jgi:hypothetical protein
MTVGRACMYKLKVPGDQRSKREDRTSVRPYTELEGGGHGSLRGLLNAVELPWGSCGSGWRWPASKPSATM